jgi:hypothetical protein
MKPGVSTQCSDPTEEPGLLRRLLCLGKPHMRWSRETTKTSGTKRRKVVVVRLCWPGAVLNSSRR